MGQIPFKLVGATLDLEGVPHRFEVNGLDDHVVWTVTFPAYFERIASLRIYDGFDRALGLTAEYRKQGEQTWAPLNVMALAMLQAQRLTLEVRIRPTEVVANQVFGFTHMEINYETVDLPYAQIPQLNRANQLFSPEDILSIEAEIDPIVGHIRKESILEVASHGSIWKIGNITNRQTAGRQLFGYQLEMTLMHASEQSTILRVSTSSDVHATYAGLEPKQGDGVR